MMMMPTLAVATAHTFVLTVSHGLLFRRPPFTATAPLPPILCEFTRFHRAAARRAKFPNLNFRSLAQSQSSPNVTSSIIALHRQDSSSRAPIACRPNPWSVTIWARSESGDPVCRPIRLFAIQLRFFCL